MIKFYCTISITKTMNRQIKETLNLLSATQSCSLNYFDDESFLTWTNKWKLRKFNLYFIKDVTRQCTSWLIASIFPFLGNVLFLRDPVWNSYTWFQFHYEPESEFQTSLCEGTTGTASFNITTLAETGPDCFRCRV